MDAVKQLRDVQEAIQNNIESIKSLLDQADALSSTINEIEDGTLKSKLEENLSSLYESINKLVNNTNSLFDELVDYANASERYKPIN